MSERGRGLQSAKRGTSIALNYVLVLGIAAMLISGLIIAGSSFVDDQRERVVQGELNVIGNHLAGNLEQVDRYAKAGDGETAGHVNQSFQRQVTGENYEIELLEPDPADDGPAQLVLTPQSSDVTVRVNATVSDDLDIESSSARGGTISVHYDGNSVVIRNV